MYPSLLIGSASSRGVGLPSFAITSNTISNSGGVVGGPYTLTGVENPINPRVDGIEISGTLQEGEQVAVTFELINNSNFGSGSHELRVYRGISRQDTAPTLGSTITSGTTTFNYTFISGDIGKYITFEVTPKLSDGTTGDPVRTKYGDIVIPAASPLDVFDEWRFEFNGGSLANQGQSGDASFGTNAPTWNATDNSYDFVTASSQTILIPKSTTYTEPFVMLIYMRLTALIGTQCMVSSNASVRFRVDSGNDWQINNTDVVAGAPGDADTSWHWVKVVWNGVNTKFQLDNGTEYTLDSGSAADSGSIARLGSTPTGSFASMQVRKLYFKSNGLLTTQEWDDVVAYLGI